VLALVGQGGMGTVYRGRDRKTGQDCAIKVIRAERVTPERLAETRDRFRREAVDLQRVAHPAIVRLLAADVEPDHPYLVMEFLEGVPLSEVGARHDRSPLTTADACALVGAAAEAVQAIHGHRMVHRDLKPSNLMLTRAGLVRLLDFGLCRFVEHPEGDRTLTESGRAMGTFAFMAPEQMLNAKAVDIRADVFALGRTLEFLLHVPAPNGNLVLRPGLEAGLRAILATMTAHDPRHRYQEPRQVAAALRPFARGSDLASLARTFLGSEGDALTPTRLQRPRLVVRFRHARYAPLAADLIADLYARGWPAEPRSDAPPGEDPDALPREGLDVPQVVILPLPADEVSIASYTSPAALCTLNREEAEAWRAFPDQRGYGVEDLADRLNRLYPED
jgi:serine/threonine protein kinase